MVRCSDQQVDFFAFHTKTPRCLYLMGFFGACFGGERPECITPQEAQIVVY